MSKVPHRPSLERRCSPVRARRRSSRPKALTLRLNQRSEEHTSELQSLRHLVCRLLLEKKKEISAVASLVGDDSLYFRDIVDGIGLSWNMPWVGVGMMVVARSVESHEGFLNVSAGWDCG